MMLEKLKKNLKRGAPSGLLTRKKIAELSGGIINPRTLSNLDSAGKGIEGGVMIGKTIVYPIENVIEFFEKKLAKS